MRGAVLFMNFHGVDCLFRRALKKERKIGEITLKQKSAAKRQ